jgi:flavodoxin
MEFMKSILILYGSETGTSEDVAYRVSTLLMRKNIDVIIINPIYIASISRSSYSNIIMIDIN